MSVERVGVVSRRVLWQLRRDRRTIVVILLQPILVMSIFGYAFGGEVSHAPVAVANLDRGTLGADLLAHVDAEVVDVRLHDTETAVDQAVRAQEVRVGVVIPVNFTRNLRGGAAGGEPATLVIFKDNTNLQVTAAVQGEFLEALEDTVEDETGFEGAFELDERVVFGEEDGSNLSFFVPGIAAYIIWIIGGMLTVVAVVKERTLGTLPRLLTSPLQPWEVVTGFALAYSLLSLGQAVVVLAFAAFVFDVAIQGNVVLALATVALVGIAAQGLGILVSGLSRNEFQAVQSVMLLAFPALFLAGVFSPLETMPSWMRPLTWVVPLTYAVRALRAILNHGAGFFLVWPDLVAVAAFAGLFLGVAAMTFGSAYRKG